MFVCARQKEKRKKVCQSSLLQSGRSCHWEIYSEEEKFCGTIKVTIVLLNYLFIFSDMEFLFVVVV